MGLFLHYLSLPYLRQGIVFTLEVTGLGLAGGLLVGLVLAGMQLIFWLWWGWAVYWMASALRNKVTERRE